MGIGIRHSNGDVLYAAMVQGALALATELDRSELADAIRWGFLNPRASADEAMVERHEILCRYGLMPCCYRCKGSGKKEKLLGGGPCSRCAGTGREA